MTWIPSHTTVGQHPKTRKLARRLGLSIPATVGHLHLLWHWAIEYAQTGDLSGHDAEDLAIGAMFDGNPDDLLAALVATGWIDEDDEGLRLHDWHDYTGKLLEQRARHAERMRESRARHARGTDDAREDAREALQTTTTGSRRSTSSTNTTNGLAKAMKAMEALRAEFDERDLEAAAKDTSPRIAAGEVRSVLGYLRNCAQRHAGERVRREREEAIKACSRCDDGGRLLDDDGGVMLPPRDCDHRDHRAEARAEARARRHPPDSATGPDHRVAEPESGR